MRIVVSEKAYDDLRNIDRYLSMHNPLAAENVADLIIRKFDTLRHFPYVGRERSDLFPGVRSLVAGNYLIFYLVAANLVTIARVVDGRRDIDADFFR